MKSFFWSVLLASQLFLGCVESDTGAKEDGGQAGTDADSDADTDSDTDSDVDTDSDADSDTGSDADSDADTDSDGDTLPDFPDQDGLTDKDFLTPQYYESSDNAFGKEVNKFVYFAKLDPFHHPLEDGSGTIPTYSTPAHGDWLAQKNNVQNHPAVDLHVNNGQTNVNIHAAHDGIISIGLGSPKYRNYLFVRKDVVDDKGTVLGKLVTIYAHLELTNPLVTEGEFVKKGDLIDNQLYDGTMGGPHMHFEVRYYRAADEGTEDYYGLKSDDRNTQSAQKWLGYWNPNVGYGYGNPRNHLPGI
jgi:murein DD-endopeptidase MepM/ murein hydrolase activator NlpD